MSDKPIPNADPKFDERARAFAAKLKKDPGRYQIAQADADELGEAVERFRAALQACRFGGERSTTATRLKREARRQAEQMMRHWRHAIGANPAVEPAAKLELGLKPRAKKAKPQT